MIASRTKPFLFATTALLLIAGAASARPLADPRLDLQVPPGLAAPAPAPVDIAELPTVSADSVGVLIPANGGLGLDIWANTSRRQTDPLLTGLPTPIISAALGNLTHRLLLSTADAPTGTAGRSLTSIRIEKLATLGDLSGAIALMDAAPENLIDEAAVKAVVDLMLVTDKSDLVCGKITTLSARFNQTDDWQKLAIFCLIKAGKLDEARLATDLLREQAGKEDEFFRLADAATGNVGAAPKTSTVGPPLFAALRLAGHIALPPTDSLRALTPALLLAYVQDTSSAPAVRIEAAEQAARFGLVDAAKLAEIYKSAASPKDEDALSLAAEAKVPDSPEQRALLFRLAARDIPASIRISLTARLAESMTASDLARPFGALLATLADDITPTPAMARDAGSIALTFLLQGRVKMARPWAAMAATTGPDLASDPLPHSTVTAAELQHLLNLSEGTPLTTALPPEMTSLARYYEAMGLKAESPSNGPTAFVPSPDLALGLEEAATNNKRGLTVLYVVSLLGGSTLRDYSPSAIAAAIRALKDVDLAEEARALAIEAAATLMIEKL
jgi:hypothetical protein